MTWGSIHIYYAEHDDLLLDCVSGLIGTLKSTGEISHSFFLRHWRNGPHVRLRLRTPGGADLEPILASAIEKIERYLTSFPSATVIDAPSYHAIQQLMAQWDQDDEPVGSLITSDLVRVEPYRRELGKYGGGRGVEIAEDLADASSACVLRLLPAVRHDRGARTSMAYVMTVLGVLAAGLPYAALAPFLANYSRLWSPWASSSTRSGWERSLAHNGDRLREQTERLLYGPPRSLILREWSAAVTAAMAAIDEAEDVVLPAVTLLGLDAAAQARRRYLLTNYLHTNNNRLGILPAEEAFIAFLGHQIANALCGGSHD
jgi:Lantibiotic biosynthesis dehydratase C-term